MLPVEVRIVPTYEVVANFGMLNSYSGLIFPLIASATATFLFRQFFLTVPDELAEAARVDGAGRCGSSRHPAADEPHQHRGAVRDPLHLWLEPVSLAAAHHHRPGDEHHRHGHQADVPLRRRVADWPVIMATSILAMVPPVIVVIAMQRLFIRGLVDSEK
jgi:sn-glycerol 3-phosphate transport system permease protein